LRIWARILAVFAETFGSGSLGRGLELELADDLEGDFRDFEDRDAVVDDLEELLILVDVFSEPVDFDLLPVADLDALPDSALAFRRSRL
jgi:hypothetical protein